MIFEFLFKYRLLLYQKGSIAFHPWWPWHVTLLLAGCALAGSYLLYRGTTGTLGRSWRLLLAGLRAGFLLTLLLIFLQPVLVLHSVIPQKSFVAVVYDVSRSMEIRDQPGGRSRLESAKDLLAPSGRLVDAMEKKFRLRYFRFSNGSERVAGYADVPRHGNRTDLARGLEEVTGELSGAPVSGIVLVTDGADNGSADLGEAAARLRARNIPVYPIGIGAPAFRQDAEVLRIAAPRKVLKDSWIEANVSVRSNGYAGRRAKLVARERDRILQSQEITLGSDGEVRNQRIYFTGDSSGAKLFTVSVEPLPDDLVAENNSQTVLIEVADEQLPILYVEGEPRWTFGFLRRAALEDKNLHLVSLLRQADGKFLRQGVDSPAMLERGFPSDRAELFRYKGLILGSVEASFFTFDQLRMISDFVSRRGGGFLMLGGRHSFGEGGYLNTPLEDLLPVRLGTGEIREEEWKVHLTAYGADHPVTRLLLDDRANHKRWETAPALAGLNPTGGAKPGAVALVQCARAGTSGPGPVLLAFQRFGRGKSMALMTDSTWRWRMGMDHQDNFHELFWKQMLRWLASDVSDTVTVSPEKLSYAPEEAVVLQAEVNDPDFLRVNTARVSVTVKAPSGEVTTLPMNWDAGREGRYSTVFKPREEGLHEVSAEAFQGSRSLGSSKGFFRVADSSEEFHNATLNSSLLRKLAQDTGGRYYSPEATSTLSDDISYVDHGTTRIEEKELWDMPFLFFVLIATAGAEWALRKRKGLA